MPKRAVRLAAPAEDLRATFAAIRAEIGIPEAFPEAVLDEAREAARSPRLPALDRTDVPFVTMDPPSAMDLDQAFHLERRGAVIRLRYAIADPSAFVTPGGAVDREAHARSETAYAPDGRTPLYPEILSEGAASLLPDGPRPAVVWTVAVDADGSPVEMDVERALVSSRAKCSYAEVQRAIDAGTADPMLQLLPEIGSILLADERRRGGASLGIPTQEVVRTRTGYGLSYVAPLPVEGWNAQLSLLVGRVAASIMLRGGVGVIRTMPPADPHDVERLRRVAAGLGVEWPETMSYPELLSTLDAGRSTGQAVFLQEAAVLFRAASYTAFDGRPPPDELHAAIAAPYAHCTAPLRRLVDRYANEVCLALASGGDVPPWARDALPALPIEMALAGEKTGRLERTIVDAVEAAVLAPLVGRELEALVVDLWKRHRGEVALRDPAVIAPCDDVDELGARIRVRLEEADPARRTVRFRRVGP
ncbi:MAG TPA: RNB domain-containing ribonuclease [Actinomycetota bacterium]